MSPPPDAAAVFTTGEAVPTAIATATVMSGALPPIAIDEFLVQLTLVDVLALQFHPVPVGVAVVVMPLGNASVIVMFPVVDAVPELPTVSVYVPVPPAENALGDADLVTVSWGKPTVVVVLAQCASPPRQLPGVGGLPPLLGSPPPPTEALLVMEPDAAAATVTGIEIVLVPPEAAMLVVDVHVTAGPVRLQLHGELVNDAAVEIPPGRVSSTVTVVPAVAAVPVLVTVNAYVAPA